MRIAKLFQLSKKQMIGRKFVVQWNYQNGWVEHGKRNVFNLSQIYKLVTSIY